MSRDGMVAVEEDRPPSMKAHRRAGLASFGDFLFDVVRINVEGLPSAAIRKGIPCFVL